MRGAVQRHSRTGEQKGEGRGFRGLLALGCLCYQEASTDQSCAVLLQVFAQQHPLVLQLEAAVMAKVLSSSEPLDSQNTQSMD